jgi:hypothetical protein
MAKDSRGSIPPVHSTLANDGPGSQADCRKPFQNWRAQDRKRPMRDDIVS